MSDNGGTVIEQEDNGPREIIKILAGKNGDVVLNSKLPVDPTILILEKMKFRLLAQQSKEVDSRVVRAGPSDIEEFVRGGVK